METTDNKSPIAYSYHNKASYHQWSDRRLAWEKKKSLDVQWKECSNRSSWPNQHTDTGAPLLRCGSPWDSGVSEQGPSGILQGCRSGMSCRRSSGNRIDRKKTVEFAGCGSALLSNVTFDRTSSRAYRLPPDYKQTKATRRVLRREPNNKRAGGTTTVVSCFVVQQTTGFRLPPWEIDGTPEPRMN
jgi:hypothetical protein